MDRTRADALQAAVAALAADDVADVVAQARAEARVRVKDLLADALTDALVDSVHAELARPQIDLAPAKNTAKNADENTAENAAESTAENTPQPTPRPPAAPTALGVYVYGVVAAGAPLPNALPGIDPKHPPKLLTHDRLAAVVSDVPLHEFEEHRLRENLGDMRWVERTARAHEHVLERVAEQATLIPLRMCSIYRTPDGVREMLARERGALTEALTHLRGRAEWGVKVFGAPPGSGRRSTRDEGAEPPASGTDYMRRRQTERDARWRADDELLDVCATIHERLSSVSADALTAPHQRPEVSGYQGPMLMNGLYLVETVDEELFLAHVEELRAQYEALELTLVPTGPWPAYNFVPGAIGATW